MRRRPRDPSISAPLDTFRRGDWPATTELAALELWRTARAVHDERHGWRGGGVARLMVESDTGAVLTGGDLLPWNRSPVELETITRRLGLEYGCRLTVRGHVRSR